MDKETYREDGEVQNHSGPDSDLLLIRALHRAEDGYVSFGRKADGTWNDLFSIESGQIETALPRASEWLATDSYFSVNSMYRGGYGQSQFVQDFPRAYRSSKAIRRLNAVFVDCDSYSVGKDVGQVIGEIIRLEESGEIPHTSLIVRSGRGVWAFWFLKDEETGLPPLSKGLLPLYAEVQRAVIEKLRAMGADPKSKDPARMTRVPGSIHSGSKTRVTYSPQFDEDGRIYAYTLDELAKRFEVAHKASEPFQRPMAGFPESVETSPTVPRTPTGKEDKWRRIYVSRLRQFNKLRAMRGGGFSEGVRNHAAFLLAAFLHRLGVEKDEIHRQVRDLGASCKPPISNREVLDAVKSGTSGRYKSFLNRTLSDWLCISEEEAEQLESLKAAGSPEETKTKRGRKEQQRQRRQMIPLILMEQGGVLPSTRQMSRLLASRGLRASRDSVHKDYRALGLVG